MAAHAVAKQLGRNLLVVDYSQIDEVCWRNTKNITLLFSAAKDMDAIIFFWWGWRTVKQRVRNMESLDRYKCKSNTFTSFAKIKRLQWYNYFLQQILLKIMIRHSCEELLHMLNLKCLMKLQEKKLWRLYIPFEMPNSAEIDTLSKEYDNVTGADIQNAVMTAALKAARKKKA